jgi:outer membrane protein assembly factor BamD (BamD/ComL family)
MIRVSGVLVLMGALSSAPLQCTSEPDPSLAIEETPGEALYQLAQEFKRAGDHAAWHKTLEHLLRRYPSSRFAEMARLDLEAESEGGGRLHAK